MGGVDQLSLHLAYHSLLDSLNDLLDLLHGEGVVIDPDLLGVRHGRLDALQALTSLVLGELAVGQQLGGMVLVHILTAALKHNIANYWLI